jgi:hypothetical protein
MDWLLSNAIGGIKVQVNPEDMSIARQLIEEHERQRATTGGLRQTVADEMRGKSVAARTRVPEEEQETGAEDGPDFDAESPLTPRELDGSRAFRAALLGIVFPPIELYVLYLMFKVFVSTERLGHRYRNMASVATVIMLTVMAGCYAIIRTL